MGLDLQAACCIECHTKNLLQIGASGAWSRTNDNVARSLSGQFIAHSTGPPASAGFDEW